MHLCHTTGVFQLYREVDSVCFLVSKHHTAFVQVSNLPSNQYITLTRNS